MTLEPVYALAGVVLIGFAVLTGLDRYHGRARFVSAGFWLLLGVTFLVGGVLPDWATGALVLAMVVLDGTGRVGRSVPPAAGDDVQHANARRLGARVFAPVLTIPLVTVIVAVACLALRLDVNRGALYGLALGGVAAMGVALAVTRAPARLMLDEGRRLNECMGAVMILPQLLASLGVVFATAKVGDVVARAIQQVVAPDRLFLLVLANCAGMALFTMVMGNSFAAFPVIAAGVLVPMIVEPFAADPAMVAILTLTAGSSGTLMTPMAANFNIVPAALLEMRDPNGVIKFQLPVALAMWTGHVVLMWGMIRLL